MDFMGETDDNQPLAGSEEATLVVTNKCSVEGESVPIPAWIRYMPTNKHIPKSTHSTDTSDEANLASKPQHKNKSSPSSAVVKRSCNPFGPTCRGALTTEKEVLKRRNLKRGNSPNKINLETINQCHPEKSDTHHGAESPSGSRYNNAPNPHKRLRRIAPPTSVLEAATLLSIIEFNN